MKSSVCAQVRGASSPRDSLCRKLPHIRALRQARLTAKKRGESMCREWEPAGEVSCGWAPSHKWQGLQVAGGWAASCAMLSRVRKPGQPKHSHKAHEKAQQPGTRNALCVVAPSSQDGGLFYNRNAAEGAASCRPGRQLCLFLSAQAPTCLGHWAIDDASQA